MSSELEYAPFPQDSALVGDANFGRMVCTWYDLIEDAINENLTRDEAERLAQTEVIPDLIADAQEFFPERDPWHTVLLARFEANNLYQIESDARQEKGGRDE